MKTLFESIQVVRPDGYPKVKELKARVKFKTDPKDPAYNEPLSKLLTIYAD